MNDNTKIEIAVEIMAAKIAMTSRENTPDKEEKLEKLLEERTKVYQYDEEIIDKVINVYGNEINKKG